MAPFSHGWITSKRTAHKKTSHWYASLQQPRSIRTVLLGLGAGGNCLEFEEHGLHGCVGKESAPFAPIARTDQLYFPISGRPGVVVVNLEAFRAVSPEFESP